MAQPSIIQSNDFNNVNTVNNAGLTNVTTVNDLQNQIYNLQSQLQQLNKTQANSISSIPTINNQLNNLADQINNTISYDDIPVGSILAKEFNLNFGDLDIIENIQNGFIFGTSVWGTTRIGGYSTNNG